MVPVIPPPGDKPELDRFPEILESEEKFSSWLEKFHETGLASATWLNIETKRELYYLQDYIVNLHVKLSGLPNNTSSVVGLFISQDFIDLASSLEKKAYSYFERDISKRKLSSLTDWHKYPAEMTNQRLQDTLLFKEWDSIYRKVTSFQERRN